MTAKDLTIKNAQVIDNLIESGHAAYVIHHLVEVSVAGRAPKQSPGIFALAVCCRHTLSRQLALSAVEKVCRTASTLFEWLEYMKIIGGVSWGRATRQTIVEWYVHKRPLDLAYQVSKYQSRNSWCHRDVLRLVHPRPARHLEHAVVFDKIINDVDLTGREGIVEDYFNAIDLMKQTTSVACIRDTIAKYPGKLSWEHVGKTELLKSPELWTGLLENHLPMTALIRNLNRLADIGVLNDVDHAFTIGKQLTNQDSLKKARIHPINILQAHKMLSTKHPHQKSILDSLDNAFYLSFGNIRPAGKRILIGVDVSSSMGWTACHGMSCLTARDAAAAITLMLVKTEPDVKTLAFSDHLQTLSIMPMDNLNSVSHEISRLNFGSTNAAVPIQYALNHRLNVDCFVTLTDNETWAGSIHPSVALQQYRKEINKDAKLAVLAFSSTGFSIADPDDKNMLDIAGMDTSVPDLLRSFMLGYE